MMETKLSHIICILRPYSIWRTWIHIHSESGIGFTGKSNGLDSWLSSQVMSLLFIYVCDTDVTCGFASESTSKLDLLDSPIWIRIRALNERIHWIWKIWIWIQIRIRQIKYGLNVVKMSYNVGSQQSDHYFRSVCLSVSLSVCLFVQSFSQPSSIRFGSN